MMILEKIGEKLSQEDYRALLEVVQSLDYQIDKWEQEY